MFTVSTSRSIAEVAERAVVPSAGAMISVTTVVVPVATSGAGVPTTLTRVVLTSHTSAISCRNCSKLSAGSTEDSVSSTTALLGSGVANWSAGWQIPGRGVSSSSSSSSGSKCRLDTAM